VEIFSPVEFGPVDKWTDLGGCQRGKISTMRSGGCRHVNLVMELEAQQAVRKQPQ
jgi:hypothetical protein